MEMNYFVVGTNDLDAAKTFYDAMFDGETPPQVMTTDRMVYWQHESFAFAIAIPFDKQPATNGNGTMVGLKLGSADEVRRLHKLAQELGGRCDGEPGPRGPFFSAYVRDLDNNKICLFE
ncbi:MAG: VOC family protein [Maricaulis sp.]|jgi:predicted lactoylglutathione lyase|uniref:VOC family protein n=1 Tax=Maricaulis sp. TaxID=1486257 RepID=UPI001B01C46C|nr:VOC family protein [Maricaulis sp.]MBO6729070.1 VOC family protein [Maricaulis sp.]MBO6846397.1 VOC family protein [Maricaulis sp.]MBO6876628.1 VOC family protein [Maricaulis sp.]MDM7983022.1 VOC family protein [Maricaulis sp.]